MSLEASGGKRGFLASARALPKILKERFSTPLKDLKVKLQDAEGEIESLRSGVARAKTGNERAEIANAQYHLDGSLKRYVRLRKKITKAKSR